MAELLDHKYEVRTKKELEIFRKSLSNQDYKGNNTYHDCFLLDKEERNEFLKIILDPKYHVKCFVDPH